MSISIVGVDLAKEVFQVYAADVNGKKIWNRKFKRTEFKRLWDELPVCDVYMETCSSAHHWGRVLFGKGFRVKLIPAAFVRPFVKTNKSDQADAEAIVIAGLAPGMRFSSIKTIEQQSVLSLHRVRARLMKQRVQTINEVRSFLREFGYTMPEGVAAFKKEVPLILEDAEAEIPGLSRTLVMRMMQEIARQEDELLEYEKLIKTVFNENDVCTRLAEINGVGMLSATALFASIAHPSVFKNGRAMAAYLGLVPRHSGTGGEVRVLRLSKRGDPYVRSLLIHGARAVLANALKKKDIRSEQIKKLKERVGFNKACIAIANKNARVAWVLMAKGESYRRVI